MNSQARGQWLSVSEAAAALCMSARTVRRQCAAGQIAARRVGGLWQVEADAAKESAKSDKSASDRVAESDTGLNVESVKSDTSAAKNRPNQTTESAKSDTDLTKHLLEEVRFLRATVEQLQRDGAEVRAALREALKSKAPQLTASTVEPPQAAQIAKAPKPESGPKRPAKRDGGPLSIGDIADELERKLNQS